MVDAVDVRARLGVLRGAALDRLTDRVLDQLVREAAAKLGARRAALVLLLRHSIVLRAVSAKASALAPKRQLDRASDPCWHVVASRDVLAIEDARHGDRFALPGSRAYLGAPVSVDGVVVGALAVYDDTPRAFDDSARAVLAAHAAACGHRLDDLARVEVVHAELVEEAARIAFAELRNTLQPLYTNLDVARRALDVLRAESVRLRGEAALALDRLQGALQAIGERSESLHRDLVGLQDFVTNGAEHATVAKILQTSDTLAYHLTKLAGGVRWEIDAPDVVIEAAPASCVGVVVRALSLVARCASREGSHSGIAGWTTRGSEGIDVGLVAPIPSHQLTSCVRDLEDVASRAGLAVREHGDALYVVLPAA